MELIELQTKATATSIELQGQQPAAVHPHDTYSLDKRHGNRLIAPAREQPDAIDANVDDDLTAAVSLLSEQSEDASRGWYCPCVIC